MTTSRHHAAEIAAEPTLHSVPGVFYPPSGRRRLALVVVPRCFFCTGSHAHRGGADGAVRRAGCGRGAYVVKIVMTVPA